MHRQKFDVSTVLADQRLEITDVDDGIWLLSFMHYDLGCIDLDQRTPRSESLRTVSPASGACRVDADQLSGVFPLNGCGVYS